MTILSLHTYAVLTTSQAGFFLGSCFYLDAFIEDFDHLMKQLNTFKDVQINGVQKRIAHVINFNIQIIELVSFHKKPPTRNG